MVDSVAREDEEAELDSGNVLKKKKVNEDCSS